MRVWCFVAIGIGLMGAAAYSQTAARQAPAAGTGNLSGTVIDASSRAPIAGASVSVSLDGNNTRTTVQSDDAGRFSFAGVSAGRLFISAQKSGYVGGYYGVRHVFSANQFFEFDPGEKVAGIVLRMWGQASVSGRVTDETGKPIAGVRVTAHRLRVVAGRLAMQPASSSSAVTTNEQGEYRISALTPTSYLVSATLPRGTPRIYHPSTRFEHEATVLELKSSETRTNVDITAQPVKLAPVHGTVDNRGTLTGLTVELVAEQPSNAVRSDVGATTVHVDPDGTFKFPDVAPGRYVARVLRIPRAFVPAGFQSMSITPTAGGFGMTSSPGEQALPIAQVSPDPTMYAEVPLTVGEEPVHGVRLVLQPAGRIRGRVVFAGNGEPPSFDDLARSPVIVTTPGGRVLPAFNIGPIDANLTFATVGLPPGTYSLMVMPPRFAMPGGGVQDNWLTRWSNSRTTQDVQPMGGGLISVGTVDVDVTLTFSTAPMAGIQGSVFDAAGKPVPEASVFIVHADRRLWTMGAAAREVRPGRRGRYEASLTPGEYLVMASTTAPEHWAEVSALEQLMRGATRVTLREGEKQSLDLRVQTGK